MAPRTLPERQRVLGHPRAHQVQRTLPTLARERVPRRLAVDRHELAERALRQLAHPRHEATLEVLRVERFEDASEGVRARDAAAKIEKRRQPLVTDLGDLFDVLPTVRACDHREDRHDHDVHQRVALGALDARVLERCEVILNAQALRHP